MNFWSQSLRYDTVRQCHLHKHTTGWMIQFPGGAENYSLLKEFWDWLSSPSRSFYSGGTVRVWVDHTPPSRAEAENEGSYISTPSISFYWGHRDIFTCGQYSRTKTGISQTQEWHNSKYGANIEKLKIRVLWDVMSCGIVGTYQCCGGVWCIHFQNWKSHILQDETRTLTNPPTKTSLHKQILKKKIKTCNNNIKYFAD